MKFLSFHIGISIHVSTYLSKQELRKLRCIDICAKNIIPYAGKCNRCIKCKETCMCDTKIIVNRIMYIRDSYEKCKSCNNCTIRRPSYMPFIIRNLCKRCIKCVECKDYKKDYFCFECMRCLKCCLHKPVNTKYIFVKNPKYHKRFRCKRCNIIRGY